MEYCPLHVHLAEGSIGDSILQTSDYVKRGKEYGLTSLAMTDHGSLSAMYLFYDECKKNDIKPIIGMEAYEAFDNQEKEKGYFHTVLLAKNIEGFRNLLRIHNNAALDGFYYKPRTDMSILKKFGKGIIGLSACVGGRIPQAILEGNLELAEKLIGEYKECFDEFYLEIQPGNFEAQIKVNKELVNLSHKTGTPLVVTNDIHYLNQEDYRFHDAHVKLGRNQKKFDDDTMVYPDSCYWFMGYDDIINGFTYDETVTPEIVKKAIDNAKLITEACNTEIPSDFYMPKFSAEATKQDEMVELYQTCMKRLEAIIENKPEPQKYVDRLLKELKVIKDKGFCGYFLIVADYVNWAKDNHIAVGPGRGSAAGSLVAYLLGISMADPIEHGLLFERFLDPNREAIPDIDIDFSPEGRDKMFEYAVSKYGINNCALVSTFGVRKAKGAVKDAARVLGYKPAVGDEMSEHIPTVFYGDAGDKMTDLDIDTTLQCVPEFKALSTVYPDVTEMAKGLEGLYRNTSIHAAGIIIAPIDLREVVPLIRPNREGILATSLNLKDAEKHLVKFDFLSVATLSVINNTEKDVGWKFDFTNEELFKDEEVWKLISSRNTIGLFQIASSTYRKRMPRLKPKTIDELAACLALIRGPSISAGTDETYMKIIEGKQEVQKIHPIYDEITKNTNGILIYQEQVMYLAVAFGMDLSTGYRIVKAGAKKKFKVLEEYRKQFLELAPEHDCDQETANKLFDMVVDSAKYSFNKSHAVSYALITYASAYMKTHYPTEYMKNLLSNTYDRGDKDKYSPVVRDCLRMRIEFLPPDINKSSWNFTVEDGKIRIGLCAVRGFGEKAAEALYGCRPVTSLEQLREALGEKSKLSAFNKTNFNAAIFSGMFDEVESNSRKETYVKFMALRKEDPLDELSFTKKTISVDASSKDLDAFFLGF